jgi:4-diphosphocytidyl-2-C-methyl-D-erythritol kinase
MLSLPSYAKINLTLRVLGRRDDGYHELFTVFQTVSLCDILTFEAADTVELICDDPSIPVDESNLILKALRLMQTEFSVTAGVRIRLEKRIPAGGGLGGGSSNAAITLLALRRLWRIDADHDDLSAIAARLGADVPYFLIGGTATGTGTGTQVDPVSEIKASNILIVTPSTPTSTAAIFGSLNVPALTSVDPNRILRICRFGAGYGGPGQAELINDLEQAVFEEYPEVRRVRDKLVELGAARVTMSGSGASVFAIFDKEETRRAAIKALDKEVNWRKFAVATISRNEYREALKQVI